MDLPVLALIAFLAVGVILVRRQNKQPPIHPLLRQSRIDVLGMIEGLLGLLIGLLVILWGMLSLLANPISTIFGLAFLSYLFK
jgi:hypothetical protein